MKIPPLNLVILQPLGYVHSLAFLDVARYLRFQFRRLGAEVSLSKNRLREDAINFIFGAHLGVDPRWLARHACVIVNLEQLGTGGAVVSPDYMDLLRSHAVLDYDTRNVTSYAQDPGDVPVLPLLHAPYLQDIPCPPLSERPIDLLFFGSMNPRREAFLKRIEATGVQVSLLDQPIYGPERDVFIRQARAVLNCHFYESSRFEQVRAFHCLSLGTPMISERLPTTQVSPAYEDAVFWLDPEQITRFFTQTFRSEAFEHQAQAKLAHFQTHDPIGQYADALAFAIGFDQGWRKLHPAKPWQPQRLNIGSGRDYRPGWLNIDLDPRARPDLVLDLSRPLALPALLNGEHGGQIELREGGIDRVVANNVLQHVSNLPGLMTRLLALLRVGGELEVEVPCEGSLSAWQDPDHKRAMNENSWTYYTDWFWHLGWLEHRFALEQLEWLDLQHAKSTREQAAFMRVVLRKVETTAGERTRARSLMTDFGDVPLDDFDTAPATADRLSSREVDFDASPELLV